jgi:hypothetical protein
VRLHSPSTGIRRVSAACRMRPALGFACSAEGIVPRDEVGANGVMVGQAGDCAQKCSTHFLTVMRNSAAFNEATPRVPIAQHHS